MHDCLFCKIARKEIPSNIVYEDEDVLAFLDIKPVHPGHTLVIAKAHSKDFSELDLVDMQAVYAVSQKVTNALLHLGAQGANVTTNIKPAGGQVIMHTHVHVIPRYKDDGLHLWPQKEYEPGDDKAWQQRLSSLLRR